MPSPEVPPHLIHGSHVPFYSKNQTLVVPPSELPPKASREGGAAPALPLAQLPLCLKSAQCCLPPAICSRRLQKPNINQAARAPPSFLSPLCSGLTSPPLAFTHLCREPWAQGGAKNAAPGARRCWGAGRDHAHTHSSRCAGVIRLLFLCHPKRVRGITAAGIKKGLNIFIPKLKEPM